MKISDLFPPEALAVTGQPVFSVVFPAQAEGQKKRALMMSEYVIAVNNADDQKFAVAAQFALKELLKLVEDQIQTETDKANDFKKRLWAARDQFLKETRTELDRVTRLIGDFQTLQLAKARAAESLRNTELLELERQRAEAAAKANSHDELDAIAAEHDRLVRELPSTEPVRVAGQIIKQDYDITVTDKWALARANPGCVKIDPLMGQIKALIKAGVKTIPGVIWKEQVRADVRLNQKAIIEV